MFVITRTFKKLSQRAPARRWKHFCINQWYLRVFCDVSEVFWACLKEILESPSGIFGARKWRLGPSWVPLWEIAKATYYRDDLVNNYQVLKKFIAKKV